MTPDMKRLCEAADVPLVGLFAGRDITTEAIVRAVLTELREVSKDMEEALIDARYVRRPPPPSEETGLLERRMMTAKSGFTAMIDHILVEPATA